MLVVLSIAYCNGLQKNRRHSLMKKLLQEIEHRNVILEKELEFRKKFKKKEREFLTMHDDLGAGISALKLKQSFLKQKVEEQHLKKKI